MPSNTQFDSLPEQLGAVNHQQMIAFINRLAKSIFWLSPVMNRNLGKIAPPAEYLRDGLPAYANGTDWNPGSGRGIYRYSTVSASWEFVG